MSSYIYLIPLLPLLGFLFNFTVGVRLLTPRGHGHGDGHGDAHGGDHHGPSPLVGLVACGTIFLSFIVSVYAAIQAHGAPDHKLVETLWTWIPGGVVHTAAG